MSFFSRLSTLIRGPHQALPPKPESAADLQGLVGSLLGHDGIVCCIDSAGFLNGRLAVSGWLVHESAALDEFSVLAEDGTGSRWILNLTCGLPRDDVAQLVPASPDGLKSGFVASLNLAEADEVILSVQGCVSGAPFVVELGVLRQVRGYCPPEERDGVLVICEKYEGACRRYRAEHLVEQLSKRGLRAKALTLGALHDDCFASYRHLVIQRTYTHVLVEPMYLYFRDGGGRVLFEIDDAVFDYDLAMQTDLLRDYPLREAEDVHIMHDLMSKCDGIITSTLPLSDLLSVSFPNMPVFLNQNVADDELLSLSAAALDSKRPNDGKVRLGYFAGSRTHDRDLATIEGVLEKLMRECPEVVLTVVGSVSLPDALLSFDSDRVERFDRVSWQELPKLIARVDINLLPLEHTEFNEGKSAIKWMEAALVGVPTVATSNRETSRVIADKDTGLLCMTSDDWQAALTLLINNADERRSLGGRACDAARLSYTTSLMNTELFDFLSASDGLAVRT